MLTLWSVSQARPLIHRYLYTPIYYIHTNTIHRYTTILVVHTDIVYGTPGEQVDDFAEAQRTPLPKYVAGIEGDKV